MSPPTDTRPARACLRLEALLRDQPPPLNPPARRQLRQLAAARHGGGLDRRALVEGAALVLSELVDQNQLSDDTADRLWLALAGCAGTQHWLSRSAAEASSPEPTPNRAPARPSPVDRLRARQPNP